MRKQHMHESASAGRRGLAALDTAHAAFAGSDPAELEAASRGAVKEARELLSLEGVITLNTTRVTVSEKKSWQSAPYSTRTLSLTAS